MSKQFLRNATYSVHKFFEYHAADLSFATRYDYEKNLKAFMEQLHENGNQISNIRDLKAKHVGHLVKRWQEEGLSVATVKNRLSMISYVAYSFHKPEVIRATKELLAVLPKRVYISSENKAIDVIDMSKITDPLIKASINLQRLFGLRREECIKFIPSLADRGDHVFIKASWAKGGIERLIPITTTEQRNFMDELQHLIKKGNSMIPEEKNYRAQLYVYVAAVSAAGLRNLHGLRHAHAQRRYKELTSMFSQDQGWECPKKGGPTHKQLNELQKQIDIRARQVLSNELGHSRINITRTYIG